MTRTALLLLLLVGLPACGDDPPKPAPPAPQPENPETPAERVLLRRDMFMLREAPPMRAAADTAWPGEAATPVVGLEVGGDARAYPLCQLAYHGAVLDTVGDRRVLVTYARWGDAADAFDAGEDEFGIAGIGAGDILLYDKRTQSTWSTKRQACVDGFRAGESFTRAGGARVTTWGEWRKAHPGTRVMQREGHLEDRYFPESWRPSAGAPVPGDYGEVPAAPPPERMYVEPDMFPTLDDPAAVPAAKATLVTDTDEVLGLEIDGVYRAYPAYVMAYYHAVNDTVAGKPVFVTFCTVCSSGMAYTPRIVGDPRVLRFGFEGIVDALPVYYDRQTRSRWMHISAKAFDGWFAGAALEPAGTLRYTTWGAWKQAHPETTLVEAPMAGLPGDYSEKQASYRGKPFVPEMMQRTLKAVDPRLPQNTLCFGLTDGARSLAIPFAKIREAGGVLELTWGGEALIVVLFAGDTAVAFRPTVDGEPRTLRFATAPDVLRDAETKSTWGPDGRATSGAAKGKRLPVVRGVQVEWYGWAGVHPGTEIHGQK